MFIFFKESLRKIIGSTFLIGIILFNYSVAEDNDIKKPNIVLVLMDNFGYGEIGVYGGGVLRGAPTPNIDSIAYEGFQLTNYNVEAECTPSRSALMTGRYGIRTRQRPDGPPRGVWYGITKWEVTLAEKWGWFGVMYRLTNGEIVNLERITNLGLLE